MLPTDPFPETLARARHVEELGYDHLWTYDHLSWRRYRGRPWFASMPWLTAMAATTSRIRLGTMVTSPNFRNPVALAQEAVTLDHISGGRFVLGIGAGGVGFDATVFGREPLAPAELVARLGEFVEVLGRLFAEPTVSHRGAYYTLNEAVVAPAAVQVPRLPIAVAAVGPKALDLAARHADAWITLSHASDDVMRARVHRLEDACAAIGRDPASIPRISLIDETEGRPLASAGAFDDFVGRYAAIGFTDLVFHHPRADDPVWDEPESIVDEIATDVLPRWRS